jgi:hypothetical protein
LLGVAARFDLMRLLARHTLPQCRKNCLTENVWSRALAAGLGTDRGVCCPHGAAADALPAPHPQA